MKKTVLLLALLAVALPSAILMQKKEGRRPDVNVESFMEDVVVVNIGEGGQRWRLMAEHISIPERGASLMSDVKIEFPQQGVVVVSASGTYDLSSRELTLDGDIEARTDDYRIRTASIHLDTNTGDISTTDRVVLEGANFVIEGMGMRANSDKKVRINENVKARFF